MEITDAMRAAVLAEQCQARGGHTPSFETAMTTGARGGGDVTMVLGGPDDRAPHCVCTLCGRVFLVLEDGADDYDAAETALIGRLPADDRLAVALRARRDRRLAPPIADQL